MYEKRRHALTQNTTSKLGGPLLLITSKWLYAVCILITCRTRHRHKHRHRHADTDAQNTDTNADTH